MADLVATLLDDFNRANEGPPPSASWTNGILTFTAGEGLVVLSNQCTRAGSGGFRQGSYWSAADFGPNVCLIVDLAAWTNAADEGVVLYGRLVNIGASATDGYGLDIETDGVTTTWGLWRIDNAAVTVLTTTTQAVASGDQIALVLEGSSLTGYRKPAAGSWTSILSATDSTYSAAGKVGAEIVNGQNTKLDNFSARTVPPVTLTMAPHVPA